MTTASGERTRALLLSAAAAEIVKLGYAGASMSHIAAPLGYTKGVFAHHYPYKSAILKDLSVASDRLIEECTEQSAERAPEGGIRGLAAFLEALSRAAFTDTVAAAVMAVVVDGSARRDKNAVSPTPWHNAIVSYLDSAEHLGEITFVHPHAIHERAQRVMSGVTGMCLYYAQCASSQRAPWPVEPVMAMAGLSMTTEPHQAVRRVPAA